MLTFVETKDDHVRPGLRGIACGKHVIFYRVLSRYISWRCHLCIKDY